MARLLVLFLLFSAPALAQSLTEQTGINALIDKPPTATDLLLELHQFDLFQLQIADTVDKRGDDGAKALAKSEAALAEKRGEELLAVQKTSGLEFAFPEEVSKARDNRLGGLGGSVAEVFLREYYEAMRTEYGSVLSALNRYVAKPDNDRVKAFADRQITSLEAGLKKVEAAQTQGPQKPASKDKSTSK